MPSDLPRDLPELRVFVEQLDDIITRWYKAIHPQMENYLANEFASKGVKIIDTIHKLAEENERLRAACMAVCEFTSTNARGDDLCPLCGLELIHGQLAVTNRHQPSCPFPEVINALQETSR